MQFEETNRENLGRKDKCLIRILGVSWNQSSGTELGFSVQGGLRGWRPWRVPALLSSILHVCQATCTVRKEPWNGHVLFSACSAHHTLLLVPGSPSAVLFVLLGCLPRFLSGQPCIPSVVWSFSILTPGFPLLLGGVFRWSWPFPSVLVCFKCYLLRVSMILKFVSLPQPFRPPGWSACLSTWSLLPFAVFITKSLIL